MKLVTPDLKILKYAFAAICCISVVTCLTRFDYNLPLFAILYWKFDSIPFDRRWRQLRYIMALIILSIFQDLWYILYWYPKIFSDDWTRYTTPLTQLSSVTMGLASITLIIKVCLISGLFFPVRIRNGGELWGPKQSYITHLLHTQAVTHPHAELYSHAVPS
eukprot:Blabericola_migrator_1__11047@NODE_6429_length_536_cov_40_729211_g1121_i3_p1_GENE_NODE_6429_length_536_cov_40_729211_g1121_i3NODE_6429_length_536_cov_40_729211_g1121_i3_p1_ORF_typecomplete_len162_score11_03AGTRAP/PF06396_11/0_05_NODE_6429_length_536_cov_40_729211_g1121_i338523